MTSFQCRRLPTPHPLRTVYCQEPHLVETRHTQAFCIRNNLRKYTSCSHTETKKISSALHIPALNAIHTAIHQFLHCHHMALTFCRCHCSCKSTSGLCCYLCHNSHIMNTAQIYCISLNGTAVVQLKYNVGDTKSQIIMIS